MYLGETSNLRLSIKLVKSTYIKSIHWFIYGNDKNWSHRENLCNFESLNLKITYEEFENKLTEVLENFIKVELIQNANFLKIDIQDTERGMTYIILPVLTDEISFNLSFDITTDTEDVKTGQDIQQTDETLINRTPKQKEIVSFSCEIAKGNATNKNISSMNESREITLNNLNEKEDMLWNWEKN